MNEENVIIFRSYLRTILSITPAVLLLHSMLLGAVADSYT